MAMPVSKTFPRLVAEMADRFPEREAIVSGDVRLTYRQLQHRVGEIAAGLHAAGLTRGDKVGVLMGNRAEWIVGALAVTSLGAVVVAVNTWATVRELGYVLDHSDARFLLAVPRYLKHDYDAMLRELRATGALGQLEVLVSAASDAPPAGWIGWDALVDRGRDVPPSVLESAFAAVEPDDLAYLVYTSGSTSTPKGVQLMHRGMIENPWRIGERQHATHEDRVWLAVSLFWGFGCINAMMNLLTHGGCIVLQETFDAGEALALIERERCTLFYGTPNMAQAMHEHPDRDRRDLSSLRSGATLGSAQQIARVMELGARDICNVYGLTEVYGNCHATDAGDPVDLRQRCVGRPIEGFVQRIVDPASGRSCGVGEVGEIRVKGCVTPAYYKEPAITAQAFDEQGYFRTGDLGYVDEDGRLYFFGRLKEMVKTGGISVSPAEVEATLMTHPGVQLALVVGVPDDLRDEVLAAVIVPRPGLAPSEDELAALCRERLAAYKVPRKFTFAAEAALPLTTTGKVQKSRIAERFFGMR